MAEGVARSLWEGSMLALDFIVGPILNSHQKCFLGLWHARALVISTEG